MTKMTTILTRCLLSGPLALGFAAAPATAQAAAPKPADAATTTAMAAAATDAAPMRSEPTDAQISDAVEDELLFDPAVPSARIDAVTTDGVVTLTGAVDNLLAKERALGLAEAVRGVRAVVNRIEVAATTRANRSIRSDIRDALLMDPATESFAVTVDVEGNGEVTLTGTVDSYAEWRLCEVVAKGVRGVRSLDNLIEVRYATERSDSEILHDVEGKLAWDRFVDDGLIEVQCQDGKVTLTGVVGSATEKQRARARSWVAGVEGVDASGLAVERWARDDDLRGNKYVTKPDSETRQAVEDALFYDPRVASFEVDVTAANGVVTLRGAVDNLKARRAAEQDARNCVGVWSVDNRINVRPAAPRSDATIAEDVRDAMLRDPWVDEYEIDTAIEDGTVTLSGDVDSRFERARADDVASRVAGVVAVENELTVDDTAQYRFDPYVDQWYWPSYHGWYYYGAPVVTTRSDTEILDDIRDELWWSPFVDDDEVAVVVTDGVATLTGTVDSLSESMSATENAYEGGAVHVVNELEIAAANDSQ